MRGRPPVWRSVGAAPQPQGYVGGHWREGTPLCLLSQKLAVVYLRQTTVHIAWRPRPPCDRSIASPRSPFPAPTAARHGDLHYARLRGP